MSLANFNDRARNLRTKRDQAIRAAKRAGAEKYGFRRRHFNREVSEKESRIRTECRAALAALFAKLYAEQEEHDGRREGGQAGA